MAKMPVQKPGQSEQSVQTPSEFLEAVRTLLGIGQFDIDLAADAQNTACPTFYSEADDSLIQPWMVGSGWNWLNPPYSKIGPWVQKANGETMMAGAKTAVLVPASVGSNWWADYVHGKAYILFPRPRLKFVGHKTCYPKDLALLLYAPYLNGGYNLWYWKGDSFVSK